MLIRLFTTNLGWKAGQKHAPQRRSDHNATWDRAGPARTWIKEVRTARSSCAQNQDSIAIYATTFCGVSASHFGRVDAGKVTHHEAVCAELYHSASGQLPDLQPRLSTVVYDPTKSTCELHPFGGGRFILGHLTCGAHSRPLWFGHSFRFAHHPRPKLPFDDSAKIHPRIHPSVFSP